VLISEHRVQTIVVYKMSDKKRLCQVRLSVDAADPTWRAIIANKHDVIDNYGTPRVKKPGATTLLPITLLNADRRFSKLFLPHRLSSKFAAKFSAVFDPRPPHNRSVGIPGWMTVFWRVYHLSM